MIVGALPTPTDLAARVDAAEYARLLDYPDRRIPGGRARRRAEQCRDWYAREGRPWAFARSIGIDRVTSAEVRLEDGELFASEALAGRLGEAEASAVVAVGVSAGSAVDDRSERLWAEGRPDEGYFLDRFAAAVVEHLAGWAGRHLREVAGQERLTLLPGISPGCEGWDLDQQPLVARYLTANGAAPPSRSFEVLSTGMVRPKSSLITVFGLTPRVESADAAWRRQPCSWCSLAACGFRRGRVAGYMPRRGRRPLVSPANLTYDRPAEKPE